MEGVNEKLTKKSNFSNKDNIHKLNPYLEIQIISEISWVSSNNKPQQMRELPKITKIKINTQIQVNKIYQKNPYKFKCIPKNQFKMLDSPLFPNN